MKQLKRREELQKKHYPIWWEIKDSEIQISNRLGKKLSNKHIVYQTELSFIQDEIAEMRFSGEICLI